MSKLRWTSYTPTGGYLCSRLAIQEISMPGMWEVVPGRETDQSQDQTSVQGDSMSALQEQVGGQHYKEMAIQPVEFIHANNIGYIEGAIIKYACRWRKKNGVEDLKKIIHFAQLLIQLEENK